MPRSEAMCWPQIQHLNLAVAALYAICLGRMLFRKRKLDRFEHLVSLVFSMDEVRRRPNARVPPRPDTTKLRVKCFP